MSDSVENPVALVVETNYLIASVIETPLAERGYDVLIATSATEAIDILHSQPIALALIDFRLQHGEPDGLVAVLTRLGVPYIFCTAASTTEVAEAFPGAVVVAKPFSDRQLLETVASVVGAAAIPAQPSA